MDMSNNHIRAKHRRVLLFVRAPEMGKVKTRLEKHIHSDTVLALYRHFVEDILNTLNSGGYDTIVFFTPPDREALVQEWLGKHVPILPQTGDSLGRKMRNAFSTVFASGANQAVLMGSDFPDLDICIVDEAFASLQEKHMTIGPAKDGGYYLIGFRADTFRERIFSNIDWGTSCVFAQTIAQIKVATISCHFLPPWNDIDTYEDLVAFYDRNNTMTQRQGPLKTMRCLNQLFRKGSL